MWRSGWNDRAGGTRDPCTQPWYGQGKPRGSCHLPVTTQPGSRAGPGGVQGAGAAGAPPPVSPEKGARPAGLLQLRHLLAGAWGTLCQGSGPREGQSPRESRTPGGAPVGAWGCPRDPFTVDPQHQTPTQPTQPAVPVRGLEKQLPALTLSPASLSSLVQKPQKTPVTPWQEDEDGWPLQKGTGGREALPEAGSPCTLVSPVSAISPTRTTSPPRGLQARRNQLRGQAEPKG